MKPADMKQDAPAQNDDPNQRVQDPPVSPQAATTRTLTHYVDPYDMNGESQLPDEPGYGHGV
jgi:hypothetical protein